MPQLTKRGYLRYMIHACLATPLVVPAIALAQNDDAAAEVEEVIVTGSYIRNSAFAEDANVSTVTQAELFESGAPSMENYIRDLTYTQNTDVVANVLASQDGGQDSVGARKVSRHRPRHLFYWLQYLQAAIAPNGILR